MKCPIICLVVWGHSLTASPLFLTGETDWKLLAIDINDPLAAQLNGKSYGGFTRPILSADTVEEVDGGKSR